MTTTATRLLTVRACTIEGCSSPHKARGYCNRHWFKWRRNGDPLAGDLPRGTAPSYFRQEILSFEGDECLNWPFGKNKAGYGRVTLRGAPTSLVHVLVCGAKHGDRPTPDHEVAHNCGNPSCCNYRHLRWATRSENNLDRRAHGTSQDGERHYGCKLTDAQVEKIRAIGKSVPGKELAKQFDVAKSTISQILSGHHRVHKTGQLPAPKIPYSGGTAQ